MQTHSSGELDRIFTASQNVFFLSSQELILRMDSWKAPKGGAIAHQYLVSERVLVTLSIPSPSNFLLPHFPKKP